MQDATPLDATSEAGPRSNGDATIEEASLLESGIPHGGDEGDAGPAPDGSMTGSPSGVLDTSFGGTGYVFWTGIAETPTGRGGSAKAVVIDSSGRIVVTGWTWAGYDGGSQPHALISVAAAWRVSSEGAFDTEFGSDGGWYAAANSDAADFTTAAGALLMTDSGAIRVVGSANNISEGSMTMWGLTPNGVLDPAFGHNGVVSQTGTAGGSIDQSYAAAADPEGRSIIVGSSDPPAAPGPPRPVTADMALWRVTGAGALDTSFGSPNGYILDADATLPSAAVIDRSGAIVIAGSGRLARYTSAGAVDPTFNGGGFVTLPNLDAHAVALDRQGRIVVGGSHTTSQGQEDRGFVARFAADGTPDSTFGSLGVVSFDGPDGAAWTTGVAGLAIDAVGRIIAAGDAYDGSAYRAVAWRLSIDGSADLAFGAQGLFSITGTAGGRGATATDLANAVTIDSAGRPVIVGESSSAAGDQDIAVWRLTP
jgi:uncharacterized delta-60 repeat protein